MQAKKGPRYVLPGELGSRTEAVARAEGMEVEDLVHEALYIHLHHVASRGKPRAKEQAVCPKCGTVDLSRVASRLAARKQP